MITRMVLRNRASSDWLIFDSPLHLLTAQRSDGVLPTLIEAEQYACGEKRYVAGYISYEAATGFSEHFTTRSPGRLPLLCLGVFDKPERVSELPLPPPADQSLSPWEMGTSHAAYLDSIETIKHQIALGNSYQINFTIRQHADGVRDPWALFLNIARDAPYASYLEFDDFAIVSASPELLFKLDGDKLFCRPMKGTAARGMTLAEDSEKKYRLQHSTKDRAENVMVTDMLRNDMGRIAVPGTVDVVSLFDIEKYPTVWQMTSAITAETKSSLTEILRALFPCASVTGAPKASSMAIIADLEDTPREVYTGSIGYFGPGRQAQFNVAIRTAWVDRKTHQATYGTGGGIVWDSVAEDEYQECMIKTKVLAGTVEDSEFELLETMRWTHDEGYFLLDLHLRRLSDSAEYFDFDLDRTGIEAELTALGNRLDGDRYRIRLLAQRSGTFHLTAAPLATESLQLPLNIRLSAHPVDVANPFLYHKTTRRNVYSDALESVVNCDDVLLWNEDGFITETTVANIVIRSENEWISPPIRSGLLAGTFRQSLLQQGIIEERNIHKDDLAAGQTIMLINSVREWYEGCLYDETGADSFAKSHSPLSATIR